jgi:hypothetical protein
MAGAALVAVVCLVSAGTWLARTAGAFPAGDTTAPTTAVTFPVAGSTYRTSTWSSGCPTPGACGTASDRSGVQSVGVRLQQQASGKYWNGSSFVGTATWLSVGGTTSWGAAIPAPTVEGAYVLSVRATDNAWNTTRIGSETTVTFSIRNTPPPAPSITQVPGDPTTSTTATFAYADALPGATFRCALDSASLTACPSTGITYNGLSLTPHVFRIAAIDAAGNASAESSYSWSVVTAAFTIAGNPNGPLSPGRMVPINLRLGNPYGFAIKVTSISITIRSSSAPGCLAADNFTVSRPFVGPVTVPANTTMTLADLNVSPRDWPSLLLIDRPTVDQGACKGASVVLAYAGFATQ